MCSCATSGFTPTISGMVQRLDEREVGRRRRKVQVAARLVRLRLEREAERVLSIARVLAEEVQRVAKAFDRFHGILRGIHFGAFASAPEHVGRRAQLDAEIHRPHRLLQRIGAHARPRAT